MQRQPFAKHLQLLLLGFALLLTLAPLALRAAAPARNDLDRVWQRVQDAGAYRFDADVTQTDKPLASVLNAGHSSRSTSFHLEGRTDIDARLLQMRLWSGGGSVQLPESSLEIKVAGATALARQGNGPWQVIDDFSDLFAPQGDFLSYAQTAKNVVRHTPQVLDTVAGPLAVTRYTFDIDGRTFALRVHEQMRQRAIQQGLPATVQVDLPKRLSEMRGQGELWVGRDGLPLHQSVSLQFPPDKSQYASSAKITVDFSAFANPPRQTMASLWEHRIERTLGALSQPSALATLLAAVLGLCCFWLVLVRRRSRLVYAGVALAVIGSLVATPLLTAKQVSAFSAQQADKAAAQDAQRAKLEAHNTLEDQLSAPSVNPHADPLAAAQAKAAAAPQAQTTTGSRYFDSSCDTDQNGDLDGDGLTNLSECLLGTLPTVADTDGDGADDTLEVVGFQYNGKMWYSNPLVADSNNDGIPDGKELHLDADKNGIPDDTDGDGIPDLWDNDNDGDGVPDNLDMSPYISTGAGAAAAKTFTGDVPLQLAMNNLAPSELTEVEFQVVPTNAKHLRYTQTVLDWPLNDKQGQIQDVDGKTFYDVVPNTAANPGANGDMRLIPALEIRMPKDSANLPPSQICTRDDGSTYTCYPLLEDFNISVREITTGTLAAYVPLQLVTDSTGDNAVAFYGRMFYQAANTWGAAHDVRFVWMVQVLNDICSQYDDNICSEYSAYNQPQVVQTYDEDWFLSGLHVTEEHQADIALIYEDPAATPGAAGAPADYDKPFYADTLYGMLNELDQSFLTGRCDKSNADGTCAADGQRDMTVDAIASRFDHATNSGVSDTDRWNLPNVMNVAKHSYEAYDLGVLDTVVTQTVSILDNVFTPVWSANKPITPTIMVASEQSQRDLNLDTTHFNNDNLKWSGDNLTLDWTNTAIDTIASVKWTPYTYDPASGWTTADLSAYLDAFTYHLSSVLDPNDPDTPSVLTMNKMLYTTAYNGVSEFVEINGEVVQSEGAKEDGSIGLELTIDLGKLTREIVKWISEFDEKINELSGVLDAIEKTSSTTTNVENLLQYVFLKAQGLESKAFGAYMFEGIALVLELTDLLLEQFARNSPTTEGVVLSVEIADVVVTALNAVTKVYAAVGAFQKLLDINSVATESEAVAETVSETSSIISLSEVLYAFSFVLAIGLAVGMLVYLATSDAIQPGSPAYTTAVVSIIVTLVVTVLLLILAISNPIGLAIVALITFVDAFLALIGVQWSLTSKIAEAVSSMVYQYETVMDLGANSGAIAIELSNPDLGLRAGNGITYSLPITPTFHGGDNCFTYKPVFSDARMWFMLSKQNESDNTILQHNDWKTTPNSGFKGWQEQIQRYSDTLEQGGVNEVVPLILSTEYMIMGENEWWFLIVHSCNQVWEWGTTHAPFGDALVLDVMPATVDELVDVSSWSSGDLAIRSIDADGDGLVAASYGGPDTDDTNWDQDGDTLSDGYELRVRSLPTGQGGAALQVGSADSDGDNVPDNVELNWGTDPAKRDTDGDGLLDAQEIAPNGGWLMGYAFDATTNVTSQTRVWSDPTRSDADGDGMSDLFEQDQYIIEPAPFADPTNPLIYNPNVWNESPVALYVSDNSTDGYVAPSAAVVYTTTTINNLASGQELVGELSLGLPSGVSGAPLSQPVDINSGDSGSLVSDLTFGSSTSGYDLTSLMSLTDYDQTRWSWDEADGSSRDGLDGTPLAVAVTPVSGWEASYLVASVEKPTTQNTEGLASYVVRGDGTVQAAISQVFPQSANALISPDVACNTSGICLILYGANAKSANSGYVTGVRLAGGPTSQTTVAPFVNGEAVRNLSIATDGANFMVATASSSSSDSQTAIKVTVVSSDGSVGATHDIATVNSAVGAAAIDWAGSNYTVVWTGDGDIHRAAVNTSGAVSNASVIGAGAAWPQSNGGVHPLGIAYDEISGQSLVAYRSTAGALVARRMGSSISDEITLTDNGVDGNDVTVAISPDPNNSGWVAAWTPSAGGQTDFSAISALGALRTSLSSVDKSTLTAVALACIQPEVELILDFDEGVSASSFADSSGNGHVATCQGTECPTSGVTGKFGNAVSFDGVDDVLSVSGTIAKSSFTVAAWLKRDATGGVGGMTMVSQGFGSNLQEGTAFVFGFQDDNTLFCTFYSDPDITTTQASFTDNLWHHYACTYDKDTKKRTIYVDGNPIASNTVQITYKSQGDFLIGGNVAARDIAHLQGELDNLLVVDRALSPAEMVDVFETPLAVFDLDEAPGPTKFINAVQGGAGGICASGCPEMGVEGKAFTAAYFDGTRHINIPNGAIELQNASFTLSAWAKSEPTDQQGYILAQGPGTANQGLRFGVRPGQAFCSFWGNDLRVDITSDTDWHHWACTYDTTTKLRTLYRDGVQIGQDTATSNYIGEGVTGIGVTFLGTIDEVGVFPAALTADDVKQLYDKVKLEDESTLVCQLPLAEGDGKIAFGILNLRETTTRLGDISQSLKRTITVDGDQPTATTIDAAYFSQGPAGFPPGPYVRSAGTLVFAGSASDATSYITSVEVNDGSGWTPAAGAETWSYSWDTSGLSDGPHTIQVRATDTVGNQSAATSWHTILDNTPPNTTLSAPSGLVRPTRNENGRWQVAMSGTVSDPAGAQPGSGVRAVEVLLQGQDELQGLGWQPATINANGAWSLDYVLPAFDSSGNTVADPSGVYTAAVRATDVVSNITPAVSYVVGQFTIDAAPPIVAASDSLSNTHVISTGMAIGGPVSDNHAVQSVEVNLTPGEQMGALEGALLHLPMDEDQATAYFRDQSPANNDASCSGSHCPTVGQTGQRDGAFGFDGHDDYLLAPATLDPAASPFSAALWFNVTSVNSNYPLIQQNDGTGTGRTWLAVTDGKVRSNINNVELSGATAVAANTWHQAAVTFDGTTLTLYLDGQVDAQTTTVAEASDGDLLIGAFKTLNGFYAGLLDELVVYDRALADYEVANLYAYGQGTWAAATVSNGAWGFTIPEGDNGLEGIYQINVRGADAVGNQTTPGGQRVWRGVIDTKPPAVQFLVTTDNSGSTPSTKYECIASDFSLLQESDANRYQTTSCVPASSPSVPAFRDSDLTLSPYGQVNAWYAATITDTAQLYQMEGMSVYAGEPVQGQSLVACDSYNHCTTASAQMLATGVPEPVGGEVLFPSATTVLTSTEPITVSGDAYAETGLKTLTVEVAGATAYTQHWETADVFSEAWSFPWTPPGEGIFVFTPHIDHWAGDQPAVVADSPQAVPPQITANDADPITRPDLTEHSYLPLVANDADPGAVQRANGAATLIHLPLVESSVFVTGIYTGSVATVYVDLTPPQVAIQPTAIGADQWLSRDSIRLTGTASDSIQLHRVDVRIGDGLWQRAGLDGAGNWQLPWRVVGLDAQNASEQLQVSARATDVAGHTTTVTEMVTVKSPTIR